MSRMKPLDRIASPPNAATQSGIRGMRRSELLASLEQGRADIAAGRYDVVTRESLQAEFDSVMRGDTTDDDDGAPLGGGQKTQA
jgi:hypothetical protein